MVALVSWYTGTGSPVLFFITDNQVPVPFYRYHCIRDYRYRVLPRRGVNCQQEIDLLIARGSAGPSRAPMHGPCLESPGLDGLLCAAEITSILLDYACEKFSPRIDWWRNTYKYRYGATSSLAFGQVGRLSRDARFGTSKAPPVVLSPSSTRPRRASAASPNPGPPGARPGAMLPISIIKTSPGPESPSRRW